jgi:YidC/Oxa1 family membrane protein insertase
VLRPFETIIAVPLLFFAQLTGNAGVAILLLTILIRLILHPLTRLNLKSMRKMQQLAPQMAVLQRRYAEDRARLNVEIMNLYRSNGVNPLAGCLPMLLQLPVLFAMFRVLQRLPEILRAEGLSRVSYTFLGVPLEVVPSFGNIGANPILAVFPILSGVVTYLQQRMTVTDPQQARMFAFFPIFSAWIALSFPVGLSLYWIFSTVLGIFEYWVVGGWPKKRSPQAGNGGAFGARNPSASSVAQSTTSPAAEGANAALPGQLRKPARRGKPQPTRGRAGKPAAGSPEAP